MPTGYTADIDDNTTFREFALRCARNFGALITLREEPFDAEIPDEIHPFDYHQKELERSKLRLDELESWTDERKQQERDAAARQVRRDRASAEKHHDHTRRNYLRMLAEVEKWEPPTRDHREMKKFMHDQLAESVKFDCPDDGALDRWYKEPPPAEEWYRLEVEQVKRSITYHQEEWNKEVERAKERTEWIRKLKESLK